MPLQRIDIRKGGTVILYPYGIQQVFETFDHGQEDRQEANATQDPGGAPARPARVFHEPRAVLAGGEPTRRRRGARRDQPVAGAVEVPGDRVVESGRIL